MSDRMHAVTVNILGREYQATCPEGREAELIASASYLDEQMRSIRESGKVVGLERIAVMAALNISHELLRASERADSAPAFDAVDGLTRKIDEAIFSLRRTPAG